MDGSSKWTSRPNFTTSEGHTEGIEGGKRGQLAIRGRTSYYVILFTYLGFPYCDAGKSLSPHDDLDENDEINTLNSAISLQL